MIWGDTDPPRPACQTVEPLVIFSSSGCVVQDRSTGKQVGTGGRFFLLETLHVPRYSGTKFLAGSVSSSASPFSLWHSQLGHVSVHRLRYMVSSGKLESFIPEYIYITVSAASSQNTRPYLSKIVRHNIRLLLILFTLRGPSRVSTMGGARYYVIFVDDFSRFTWIYLLHSRLDFLQVYRDFYTMIRTQFSKNIQIFRSNSGGEYKSRPFKELLVSQGTLPQLSCTDTPQQNDGVAERKHRHIMETTRAFYSPFSIER